VLILGQIATTPLCIVIELWGNFGVLDQFVFVCFSLYFCCLTNRGNTGPTFVGRRFRNVRNNHKHVYNNGFGFENGDWITYNIHCIFGLPLKQLCGIFGAILGLTFGQLGGKFGDTLGIRWGHLGEHFRKHVWHTLGTICVAILHAETTKDMSFAPLVKAIQ
jgi:hypothetical protein